MKSLSIGITLGASVLVSACGMFNGTDGQPGDEGDTTGVAGTGEGTGDPAGGLDGEPEVIGADVEGGIPGLEPEAPIVEPPPYTGALDSRVPTLPAALQNYTEFDWPNGFDELPENTPLGNPNTDAGATLGRVLFYDVNLSANNTKACASCHIQEYGFSDPVPFSEGFDGGLTGRNSMGLANSRFMPSGRFFWDERAESLEAQVLMPIQDAVEMGMDLDTLVAKLYALEHYEPLFLAAFGSPGINHQRISRALAQFVRSMVSVNTPFDNRRGRDGVELNEQQQLGEDLFTDNERGNCSSCHGRNNILSMDEPDSNGLDANPTDAGAGSGEFRTGSLRNITLTFPYMHDGRFGTLGEVIDHYSTGIQAHRGLGGQLRDENRDPLVLNYTADEKAALLAFFETLTDPVLTSDERWSNPFPSEPVIVVIPDHGGVGAGGATGAE